jgi:hypothetical protein
LISNSLRSCPAPALPHRTIPPPSVSFPPCEPTSSSCIHPSAFSSLSPLQFVTRERITRWISFQLSVFSISALEECPSAFAQVFRRVVGVTPTEFRSELLLNKNFV